MQSLHSVPQFFFFYCSLSLGMLLFLISFHGIRRQATVKQEGLGGKSIIDSLKKYPIKTTLKVLTLANFIHTLVFCARELI